MKTNRLFLLACFVFLAALSLFGEVVNQDNNDNKKGATTFAITTEPQDFKDAATSPLMMFGGEEKNSANENKTAANRETELRQGEGESEQTSIASEGCYNQAERGSLTSGIAEQPIQTNFSPSESETNQDLLQQIKTDIQSFIEANETFQVATNLVQETEEVRQLLQKKYPNIDWNSNEKLDSFIRSELLKQYKQKIAADLVLKEEVNQPRNRNLEVATNLVQAREEVLQLLQKKYPNIDWNSSEELDSFIERELLKQYKQKIAAGVVLGEDVNQPRNRNSGGWCRQAAMGVAAVSCLLGHLAYPDWHQNFWTPKIQTVADSPGSINVNGNGNTINLNHRKTILETAKKKSQSKPTTKAQKKGSAFFAAALDIQESEHDEGLLESVNMALHEVQPYLPFSFSEGDLPHEKNFWERMTQCCYQFKNKEEEPHDHQTEIDDHPDAITLNINGNENSVDINHPVVIIKNKFYTTFCPSIEELSQQEKKLENQKLALEAREKELKDKEEALKVSSKQGGEALKQQHQEIQKTKALLEREREKLQAEQAALEKERSELREKMNSAMAKLKEQQEKGEAFDETIFPNPVTKKLDEASICSPYHYDYEECTWKNSLSAVYFEIEQLPTMRSIEEACAKNYLSKFPQNQLKQKQAIDSCIGSNVPNITNSATRIWILVQETCDKSFFDWKERSDVVLKLYERVIDFSSDVIHAHRRYRAHQKKALLILNKNQAAPFPPYSKEEYLLKNKNLKSEISESETHEKNWELRLAQANRNAAFVKSDLVAKIKNSFKEMRGQYNRFLIVSHGFENDLQQASLYAVIQEINTLDRSVTGILKNISTADPSTRAIADINSFASALTNFKALLITIQQAKDSKKAQAGLMKIIEAGVDNGAVYGASFGAGCGFVSGAVSGTFCNAVVATVYGASFGGLIGAAFGAVSGIIDYCVTVNISGFQDRLIIAKLETQQATVREKVINMANHTLSEIEKIKTTQINQTIFEGDVAWLTEAAKNIFETTQRVVEWSKK